MSSSAKIQQRIEATRAKREQERLAAEAEEAEMLRLLEERQAEEEWIVAAMQAAQLEAWEKQEAEQAARKAEKQKRKAEKRKREEEKGSRKRARVEEEDEPQAEALGSGTAGCWNCRSRAQECERNL